MKQTPDKRYILLIYAGLALATFIAFEPVRENEFINYDDDVYVTENPHVTSRLTHKSIVWAFTTSHAENWHPLTWLSHILDCQLFGLNSAWHHLTNLFLHIANTMLLFYIFKKMTNAIWPSAFIAAAFALHPLHVESVAWVAERKDVLSSLFWMLTIIAYLRYAQKPNIAKYLLVVLVLSLGLMAKPMLVTLPFVLLLLDYWPLHRLQWKHPDETRPPPESELLKNRYQKSPMYLLAEKLPLFILIGASCVITIIVQQAAGSLKTFEKYPLSIRISNALVSYLSYLIKMFYPVRLAILYPIRPDGLPLWQPIVSFIVLLVISVAVIYSGRHRRYLLVGWLWYLGTLIPVIGLVQVGSQALADRYTYLPSVGIFIIVAWAAGELKSKLFLRKIILPVSAVLVIAALLICTRLQLRHWKNSLTLYEHTLAVTEENYIILNNYGDALSTAGRSDKALVQFKKALRINPRGPMLQKNIGEEYLKLGQYDLAVKHLKKALKLKPDWPDVSNNLGAALKEMGKIDQAIDIWKKTLALDPSHPNAHFNLGLALGQQESHEQAIYHFQQALQAKPDWPEAHYNLGGAYFHQGRLDLAAIQCGEAVRLKPDYLRASVTLAHILVEMGQIQKALEIAEKASKLAADTGQQDPAPKILNRIQRYKAARQKTLAPME